jgi:hypothetical protein
VFLNNSCYSHQKAIANGVSQAAVAVTRIVGPLMAANLFAWTASSNYSWVRLLRVVVVVVVRQLTRIISILIAA